MDTPDADRLARALLDWFEEAARPLPWRSPRTLYGTVVSEFMLQQTRVTTVLPYYRRWMEAFPDFSTLARAAEARVLKKWEGLGYYQRARNLHRLARVLHEDYPEGDYPQEADSWRRLPGIGPYTAAAVASQVFGEPVAAIDGNVIRVLARLTGTDTPFRDNGRAHRYFAPLANRLVPAGEPGRYNEALMELGATICLPRKPNCLVCPLYELCRAGREGNPEDFPVKIRPQRQRATIDRVLLVRNRPQAAIALAKEPGDNRRLQEILEIPRVDQAGVTSLPAEPLASHRRAIGNTDYEERFYLPHRKPRRLPKGACWVALDDLAEVTLSGPHRRWLPGLLHLAQERRVRAGGADAGERLPSAGLPRG